MSNKHFHICDECGHMEPSKIVVFKFDYSERYYAPEKWTTFDGKDMCSRKCVKAHSDKLANINSETVHCCCKGCKQ